MDVSIIYVNYKTSQLIIDSIDSVKEKTQEVDYEIIVVDNNSEDDSHTIIKNKHPKVLFLSLNENLGFGRANNKGIMHAKGNYIFFLNPDTLLRNNAIKYLKDFLENNKDYGACGGNLYDENSFPTMSFGRRFPSYFEEFASIFYLKIPSFTSPKSYFYNYSDCILDVAFISGADLMVKKTVIDKVGGFSRDFFMTYEETELCYRIFKGGYKIGAVPNAKIMHLEGKSEYINKSRLSFFYEGMLTYFHKKNPTIGIPLIYLIVQLKNNLRLLQFIILRNKKKIGYWRLKQLTCKQTFASFKNKERFTK
ncbi:glycosyltransferase family 2 protein [Massilibacteroides vaginae]|uniref:glycosyltransferase family 2 protein n=1 Tax=Massilibacteroides vaginae TaxID=1673718 RepID=UPI000A1CBA7A|nr:glycosyltransferase family 2 protein [Massilibacteroides vaginae]